jgi:hypothetical protein
MKYRMKPDLSAFCLGGPDFDANNCKLDYLTGTLGLNASHAQNVTALCCKVEPWSHSEGILKNLLHNNKAWIEAGPFHTFIARDYDIASYCSSLDPALAWKILNFKDKIDPKNLSYYVRSIAALVACEEMGRRCKIQTGGLDVKTNEGTHSVNLVKSFDCPRQTSTNENFSKIFLFDLSSGCTHAAFVFWAPVPVRLQLAGDPTSCVSTAFRVVKCKELWKTGTDPFRIKHRWHDRGELFWLFNKQISSRVPNSKDVKCAVVENGKLTQGPCSLATSKFEYDFDASKISTPGFTQTITFKAGDAGCFSAVQGNEVGTKPCATGDISQQFIVTFATDKLVVEDDVRSKFVQDHGGAWDCCNDNAKHCCDKVTSLRDAEYFVDNA